MDRIILASASPFRRQLMENAGLAFGARAAEIDERALEEAMAAERPDPGTVALRLAEAKARAVAMQHPDAIVIGSDQTLSLDERVFHKPASLDEARSHLHALSGRTHQLNSAVVLVRNDETLWRHVAIARLTMRPLSDDFIGRYLARVGDRVLTSVGAYQLEGEGIQLFQAIEGDYFTILGLPMLPLLSELRSLGAIDA
ncbi:Maf-like protein [Rhizobium sp. TRM95111]|uniref:Maf-like protein n=1 Tax=Rhizobium alarense TaxID=2846851 RepID=UPI001F237DDB|nr:Maf-like protein [Rhizobium alarense]MCF3639966.1 Maf-like protein [Rhizobium alarense]